MLRIAALSILLVLTGCSSMHVSSDFDRNAEFSNYRTFGWMKTDASGKPYAVDGPLDGQIRAAVEQQLESSGQMKADTNPDLLVLYHAGSEQQLESADWGDGGWWGKGGGGSYTYEKGSLVIDLVDAATSELVWRGTATRAFSDVTSPGSQGDAIDKAVKEMFEKYPPTV
jgi:hypothetical protein